MLKSAIKKDTQRAYRVIISRNNLLKNNFRELCTLDIIRVITYYMIIDKIIVKEHVENCDFTRNFLLNDFKTEIIDNFS